MVVAIDAVLSGRHCSAGMTSLSRLARKDLLCVRREIAKVWLMKLPKLTPTKRGGKYPAIDKRVPPEIRFDRQDHWIEPI